MPLTWTPAADPPAALRAAAAVLLLLAAVVWCAQAARKAERQSGNDLTGYLEASRALYGGRDPYRLPERFPYIYPLFLAAAIRPLAAVPAPAASVAWFALQAACLWYVLRIVSAHASLAGLLRRGGMSASDQRVPALFARKHLVLIAAGLVAVFGDVLQSEFLNGQVNVIVLALAVAAIHLTDDRPHAAALLLGAAIAVKLTPALFLLYWLIERRYAAVLESVAWAAVFIASPWLVIQNRLWPLYESYVRDFILVRTASVESQAHAIFFTPYGFWGWLTGSAPGRALILSTALALIALLAVWHVRVRRRTADRSSAAWVYAAATPLLSPMSEVHHLTALIPAAVISTAAIARRGSHFVVGAGSALFVVLIWLGRFDRTGPWYFFSTVCLIVTAAVALQRAAHE